NLADATNLYNSPSRNPSTYSWESRRPVQWNGMPISATFLATVKQLIGTVHDANSGQDIPNVPMTGYGLWDQFMQERGFVPHFTLYRDNYVAQANLLLPRATAYSAGLLEYFFRGEIESIGPDEGVYGLADHAVEKTKDTSGFETIKVKLANKTPNQAMTNGALVAVLKYNLNTCYADDLSGQPGAPGIDEDACRSIGDDITVSDVQTGVG